MSAYILCMRCRGTFTDDQTKAASACPTCGNKGLPGDIRKKATLTFTVAEWRVLFIWAERWASERCAPDDKPGYDSPDTLAALIREAKRQAPDLPSLTLMGDLQDVANAHGRVEMHGAEGLTVIEPEKKH